MGRVLIRSLTTNNTGVFPQLPPKARLAPRGDPLGRKLASGRTGRRTTLSDRHPPAGSSGNQLADEEEKFFRGEGLLDAVLGWDAQHRGFPAIGDGGEHDSRNPG